MKAMKRITLALVAMVGTLLFFSCKKSKNGATVSLQLRAQNNTAVVGGRLDPSSIAARTQSATLTWSGGSAFVEKFDFEAEKDDNFEIEIERRVSRRIDLFGSVSQLGSIQLEPGKYDEVEVDLHLRSTGADTAFVLRGSFVNQAGTAIPIVFFITDAMEIESEVENVVLSGIDDYNFLSTFDLSKLALGITQTQLNNATVTNGTIVISKTSNTALYNIIYNNFQRIVDVELDD